MVWTTLWTDRSDGRVAQVDEHDQVWTAVAQLLRAQVSEAVWLSTFQDVYPLDGDATQLRVSAPNSHVKDRILSRYLPLVRDALEEIGAAGTLFAIEVQVPDAFADDVILGDTTPSWDTHSGGSSNAHSTNGHATSEPLNPQGPSDAVGMNPRYTFETFVKGASNQFALAAALRVAETPGRSYNPLFIYGAAGLGKTHLLHAIGHYVRQHLPDLVVRYVSTEHFLNDFIDAIRTNATSAFKMRYRGCDLLLVDDVQLIQHKERFQEEFFHTFETLYNAGRQIVLSSDRPPKEMAILEDRLRSRFVSGLLTDVQPPDVETRLAILR
ncbi:MAG: dnaA [Ilumatobacteraceae bacterium]|nr:dnaA [Ilumatobacteraceae bacterium]